MTMADDHTRLLRALLNAVVDLDELPHPRHAGRVLLAAAVAGRSCSDSVVARTASMPVDAVREITPAMLDRCLHVPALLMAEVNQALAGDLVLKRVTMGEKLMLGSR